MRINQQGIDILGAALRVQELTQENENVLVLPEDPQLVTLVARPRPKLAGGLVFFDRYPARFADDDIARLLSAPPKVVILRPREREQWAKVFDPWSSEAGTAKVMAAVIDRLLPRYHLDRRVLTRHGDRAISLEIWVRND
jgi:hypothetical protein